MTNAECINSFWNGFGLNAYSEHDVPKDATLPYITYETRDGGFSDNIAMTASLWYKGHSWEDVSLKATAISKELGLGGKIMACDDGCLWFKRSTPFSQRMPKSEDPLIRRMIININVEFLTNM